ncbi:hypothetical protein INN71_11255 [Nocardioides sp. ChNu-153]|uniref:hypothetical protein n=1 Tax=unclassified Nocardioides TaxID=2615069 RepID=UPI0024052CFA|nr:MULTISPECIES: hypothetical protein [unclassified Nocardioides]MDF9716757.1 hypothetical protein [Nocardioides sp. ChNu-99]MDN7121969.1 hypothetical protein [Nocardioides sp. ChNu-153]
MPSPDSRAVATLKRKDSVLAAVGGLVALLLLVVLAVVLPRLVEDGGSAAGAGGIAGEGGDGAEGGSGDGSEGGSAGGAGDLVLPQDVGRWTSLTAVLEEEGDPEQLAQVEESWAYADAQLVEQAGVPADAERYLDLSSSALVAIQAYRGPDGPLVPATLQDPESGQARLLLAEYGDVECVLDVVSGEVSPTPQVQEMQCRRTSDDLTVRAFVLSLADGEAVQSLVDGIWTELSA